MLDLFDKFMKSILEYCPELLGYLMATQIETVHFQSVKQVLCVRSDI